MAGLEPYNSEDDVSRSQVFRRRVLLLLGPLVTPFIARWWWIEFGDPAVWAEQDSLIRDTTARLFLQGFVRFYLAVELPLANHGRPLRIVIVSAE